MQLPPASLRAIAELARRRAGIVITDEQGYLLEARLTPVAATFGFGSLGELAAAIARHPAEALAEAVVEALTTPETSFFRDGYPFDLLRRVMLPDLLQRRAGERQLRIWSAAAATGQEAYSIGFCLEELGPAVEGWRLEVVGTDLAAGAIARAREGRYFTSRSSAGCRSSSWSAISSAPARTGGSGPGCVPGSASSATTSSTTPPGSAGSTSSSCATCSSTSTRPRAGGSSSASPPCSRRTAIWSWAGRRPRAASPSTWWPTSFSRHSSAGSDPRSDGVLHEAAPAPTTPLCPADPTPSRQ